MAAFDPDELLELERAGWRSLGDGTAATFYGELLLPTAVMVLADGSVFDREAVIASLEGSPGWDSFELADERIVVAGPDTSVLVYVGTAHRAGAETFRAAMSSVYVHRDGRWRLALYQQTPLG